MIIWWIYKAKVKPHKIKLFFVYLIFALVTFGISFISSSLLWITVYIETEGGYPSFLVKRYFLLLSFPLELSVHLPTFITNPPIWTLNIFGIEVMNITGQFTHYNLFTETRFVVDSITLMFTWVIFSINLGFVLTWIMILYAIDKKRIKKHKKKFALFHEYVKSKKRKTLIRRIFRF
ncbi:MAG: hypothetical protein ACFFAK_07190 [Promethearchaeota archaeon]